MSRLLKALLRIESDAAVPDDEPVCGRPLAQDAELAGSDWHESLLWLPSADWQQPFEYCYLESTDDGLPPAPESYENLAADDFDGDLPADLPAAETPVVEISPGLDQFAACAEASSDELQPQPPADQEDHEAELEPADECVHEPADAFETAGNAITLCIFPAAELLSDEADSETEEVAEQVPADELESEPLATTELPDPECPPQSCAIANDADEPIAEAALLGATVPFVSAADRPYRQACEEILAALPESGAQALVLAAADEDLDHSAAIVHLARVMAERLDDPVLLIDAGRHGRLAALLEAAAVGEVSDVLAGLTPWRELIVQTTTAGLCILPATADDFSGDPVAVAQLLDSCKRDFRLVLVADPSGLIPEGLLAACDAAVLLLELGHTARPTAMAAADRLASGGSPVLGCLTTAAKVA